MAAALGHLDDHTELVVLLQGELRLLRLSVQVVGVFSPLDLRTASTTSERLGSFVRSLGRLVGLIATIEQTGPCPAREEGHRAAERSVVELQ